MDATRIADVHAVDELARFVGVGHSWGHPEHESYVSVGEKKPEVRQ